MGWFYYLLTNKTSFIILPLIKKQLKQKQIMKKTFLTFLAATAVATFTLISCEEKKTDTDITTEETTVITDSSTDANAEAGVMVGGAMMVPSKNIVENAMLSNDHKTLVAAVTAADLGGALSADGPFTVFAPTDAAFNAVPKATLDALLTPEKKADLSKILTYHVVSGAYRAADLKDGQELTTLQGQKLKVSIKDGKVMINNAVVTTADVISKNGVTHVIDAVVMPK
jgi:uncharacterized surface protein with fasciclin (FAS1) repeats